MVGAPFATLVIANALNHPFRVFRAALGGLQDAWFNGLLSIFHSALTLTITIVLMMKGYGLYALALGRGAAARSSFSRSASRA